MKAIFPSCEHFEFESALTFIGKRDVQVMTGWIFDKENLAIEDFTKEALHHAQKQPVFGFFEGHTKDRKFMENLQKAFENAKLNFKIIQNAEQAAKIGKLGST